jgi:hypothetical protein
MRLPVALTAIACLLGLAGVSHAGQIASPAIYGAFTQKKAQCFIGNTGTSPIPVKVNILDESGNVVPSGSSCGSAVEAGFICSVFVNSIPNGVAFACSATTSGSASKLRGSLILYDANDIPLRSAALR